MHQLETSEAVQRAHFDAFFRPQHSISHPLPASQDLNRTARILKHCMGSWVSGGIWVRVYAALQTRLLLKRRLRARCTSLLAHRKATLGAWLAYWREAETMAHRELQARSRGAKDGTCMTARRAEQVARAQVMTSTSDDVKRQVLWQLYWLLRSQVAFLKLEHWRQWCLLAQQRRRILSLHAPEPEKHGPDIQNRQPITLRAVDAALFILALQTPRFRVRPGHELTLPELVRLAAAPQRVCPPGEEDVPLRHASSVVTAFADSPLCTHPFWLYHRYAMPVPIVPALSWGVDPLSDAAADPPGPEEDGRASPRRRSSPSQTDSGWHSPPRHPNATSLRIRTLTKSIAFSLRLQRGVPRQLPALPRTPEAKRRPSGRHFSLPLASRPQTSAGGQATPTSPGVLSSSSPNFPGFQSVSPAPRALTPRRTLVVVDGASATKEAILNSAKRPNLPPIRL
eukprot:EG_transcript_7141